VRFRKDVRPYSKDDGRQHATIPFLGPAKPGESRTAEAKERSRSGRSGIYDFRVTGSSDGSAVAEFRGHTRMSGGRFFTGDE